MIFSLLLCYIDIQFMFFMVFSGHDSQRIAQFLIGFSSLFLLLKYSAKQLSFCTVSSQVKLFF
ncbi:pilus assembly protein, partial [Pseudomonas syringae pv. actinidiae]|nr:pilus assembly protein [Pseudomonas syringae pv. actinidiae]